MPAIDVLDKFYHSGSWRKVRNIIVKHYLGLCQECGATGSEVHHKIPLTVDNVNDPMISLNPDNLTLLCKSCHDAIRSEGSIRKDLMFDADGNVIPRASPHSKE